MSRKIGIFVDVANLYTAAGKLDYREYLDVISAGGQIQRAHAYGAHVDGEAAGFIEELEDCGYLTSYKVARSVKGRPSIRHTRNNVELTLDVIRSLPSLDILVLGSNDTELIPLIRYARDRGVEVLVYACQVPPEIHETGANVIELTTRRG